uniref:Uncharacterized protein n=1 Tax=Molossus molossus TaxID=27622 RepID=A0A7J8HBY9_MOLMO|nr:hypothetical protein HJG59_011143 [Molossus molossus]
MRLDDFLQLIVKHQHEAPTHAPEDIAQSALIEGLVPLVLEDLLPAVDGSPVQDVGSFAPGLHHHPPPYGVKWVGDQARHRCHALGDQPAHHNWMQHENQFCTGNVNRSHSVEIPEKFFKGTGIQNGFQLV